MKRLKTERQSVSHSLLETKTISSRSMLSSSDPFAPFPGYKNFSLVEVLPSSERCAVLVVKKEGSSSQSVVKIGKINEENRLAREAENLSKLSHENIVKLQDFISAKGSALLRMEKVKGVCLAEKINKDGPFSEEEARNVMIQLISVLTYMHSKKWIHRDLKPDNIIYDPDTGKVKLIDFEFALKCPRWKKLNQSLGTYEYSAPEVRRQKYQGTEVDIWSLGITLYILLTSKFPFQKKDLFCFREKLVCPEYLSDSCKDFLKRMLDPNPNTRGTVKSLKLHPWLKNENALQRTLSSHSRV